MKKEKSLYLDVELLCRTIKSVEDYIMANDKDLSLSNRGNVIALLYEQFFKSGEDVNVERVARYVGMMV